MTPSVTFMKATFSGTIQQEAVHTCMQLHFHVTQPNHPSLLQRPNLQEPPGQPLPVELSKEVLVTDVGQQLDNLLKSLLNGLIRQLFTATL